MSATTQPTGSYRFGPFTADGPAGQLRKGASRIRLAGQPFEILIMLIERPGQVVTRDEIQQRLWPEERFVDFENSLNKAINKLRQALSDSAEKPLYIETLPRRGYRFVGTLLPVASEVTANPPVESSAMAVSLPPTASSSRNFSIWRIAALSLLIPLSFLVWLALRPVPIPRVLGVSSLTTSSRVDLYGGIHTDGVRLFFLVRRGHKWDLSQMPVSGGDVQRIPVPFSNARIYSVSPDGSQFALGPFDSRLPALPIWIMSSVGGTPHRLGDVVVNDAVFSRDGTRLTYSTSGGIFEIDIDGGKVRKLLDIPGEKWSLVWSPDGKRLRFHWLNDPGVPSHIWEVQADGSHLRQFLPKWTGAEGLCCGRWTSDGNYFLFLAATGKSPASIWAVREPSGWFRREQPPVRLSTEPLPVSVLLPSADNKRIYALGNNTRIEYVRANPSTREVRSLIGGQTAAWTTFAPSGDWVVYRGARNALWRSNADGSARVELVSGKFDPGLPAVRPDGKLIAFRAQPPGVTPTRIDVVSSDGGEPVEIASSPFPLFAPAWSPDGSKLSYALDADEDPTSGLYVYDFGAKSAQKISGSEKLWRHAWSPNGKFLAAVSSGNDAISVYDFATHAWRIVAHGRVFSPVLWSSDSKFIYFQDVLEAGEPVHRLRLSDLSVTTAFECGHLLEGGVQRCGLESLAPDGSFVLQLNRGDHDVYALDVDLP